MKKKILTGAMSGRNVPEDKAGLNLKKRWLVRTGVKGLILQQKNLVMTNIAESKTDERPATVELTGFPLRVKQILAPTDLTEDSRKGLRYATGLAKHFNAKLTVLHVIEKLHSLNHGPGGEVLPEDAFQELQVAGQKLDEIVEEIKKEYPAVEATEVIGSVCSHIVELATLLKSDLIVVSTHNYPWFKRLMTGSDAEKIARHAPCPILIVHQREHDFVD